MDVAPIGTPFQPFMSSEVETPASTFRSSTALGTNGGGSGYGTALSDGAARRSTTA